MADDNGIRFEDASTPHGLRIYAVGDIHGCHDLMAEMHRQIMADIMKERPEDWRIVYLGDYVDRGPSSRQVLEFLSRSTEADPRIVTLAGNHDIGFLDFLEEPQAESLFANNGGETTALSYGVELKLYPREALLKSHAALVEAVPKEHLRFLRGLRLSAAFGDLFFCHAGIRPGVPLEEQSAEDLVWIRQRFHFHLGLHPKLIIHGHTPVPVPEILPNRVNLDTGAFHTGRLTAMMFEGKTKRLLQVSGRTG